MSYATAFSPRSSLVGLSFPALFLLGFPSTGAYASGEVDLIQYGSSEPAPWNISWSSELSELSAIEEPNHALELLSRVTEGYAGPTNVYQGITTTPYRLSTLLSSDRLRALAPEDNVYYEVLFSNGDPEILQGSPSVAGPAIYPAQIVFQAPYSDGVGGVFSLLAPLEIDERAKITIDTFPTMSPVQTQASTVELRGALTGDGVFSVQGGGLVKLYAASPDFAGTVVVNSDELTPVVNTLEIKAPLGLSGLEGNGQVVMAIEGRNSPSASLSFDVADQAVSAWSAKVTALDSYQQVSKSGPGILEVTQGLSTYAGDTLISEGTLKVSEISAISIGQEDPYPISIISGPVGKGTVQVSGASATLDLNGKTLYNNVTLTNHGALISSNTTNRATLEKATLTIDSSAVVKSLIPITTSSLEMIINGPVVSSSLTQPADLHLTMGKIYLRQANTHGGTTFVGEEGPAELLINDASGLGVGDLHIESGSTLRLQCPNNASIANQISMSGNSTIKFDPWNGDLFATARTMTLTQRLTSHSLTEGATTLEIGPNMELDIAGLEQQSDVARDCIKTGAGILGLIEGGSFMRTLEIRSGSVKLYPEMALFWSGSDGAGQLENLTRLSLQGATAQFDMGSTALALIGGIEGSAGNIHFGTGQHILLSVDLTGPSTYAGSMTGGAWLSDVSDQTPDQYFGGINGFVRWGDPLTLTGDMTNYSGPIFLVGDSQIQAESDLRASFIAKLSQNGLDSGLLSIAQDKTLSVLGWQNSRQNAQIQGGGSLRKISTESLIVAHPNNTYSGGTFIDAGLLKLEYGSVWDDAQDILLKSPLGTGSVQVASGATLDLSGSRLDNFITQLSGVLDNSSNTSEALISSNSSIVITGPSLNQSTGAAENTLRSSGSGGLRIAGVISAQELGSDLSPMLNISQGVVTLEGQNTFYSVNVVGGTARIGSSTVLNPQNGAIISGPIGRDYALIGAQGRLDCQGYNLYNPVDLSGTLMNSSEESDVTVSGPLNLRGNAVIDAGNAGKEIHITGLMAEGSPSSLSIAKGTVSLEMELANISTGSTMIGTEGVATLKISRDDHLPRGGVSGPALVICEHGTLDLDPLMHEFGSSAYPRSIELQGALRMNCEDRYVSVQLPHTYGTIYANVYRGENSIGDVPGTIDIFSADQRVSLIGSLQDGSYQDGEATLVRKGEFVKKGLGTLRLEGESTMTGTLVIAEGGLQLGSLGRVSPQSSIEVRSDAVLDLRDPFDQYELEDHSVGTRPVTIEVDRFFGSGGRVLLDNNSLKVSCATNEDFYGTFDGQGSVIQIGFGNLHLYGGNSGFQGSLKVGRSAQITLHNDFQAKALGSGVYDPNTGLELLISGCGPISIGSEVSLIIDPQGEDQDVWNSLQGEGSLIIRAGNSGAGDKTVTIREGGHTYSGGTRIESGKMRIYGSSTYLPGVVLGDPELYASPVGRGAIWVGSTAELEVFSSLLPGDLTLQGNLSLHSYTPGQLQVYTGTNIVGRTLTLDSSLAKISVESEAFACIYSKVTGNYGLHKYGPGRLDLANEENSYTGLSVIHEGDVRCLSGVGLSSDWWVGEESTLYLINQNEEPSVFTGSVARIDETQEQPYGTLRFFGGEFTIEGDLSSGLEKIWIHGSEVMPNQEVASSIVNIMDPRGLPPVHLDGALNLHAHENLVWESLLSGVGSFCKYGAYPLVLRTSSLQDDGFTGFIGAYEGKLELEPGLSEPFVQFRAEGTGVLCIDGSSGDPIVSLSTLFLTQGGTLDLSCARDWGQGTSTVLQVHTLSTTLESQIILRPTLVESDQSVNQPLFYVTDAWTKNESSTLDIYILPKASTRDSVFSRVPLLKMDPSDLEAHNNQNGLPSWLSSSVKTGPFFEINGVSFDEGGILGCDLRRRSVDEIFMAPELSELPLEYQTFGKAIFAIPDSMGSVGLGASKIYEVLANSRNSSELSNRIRELFPSGVRALLPQIAAHKGSSSMVGQMIGSARSGSDLQRLMGLQGRSSSQSRAFAKKAVASQYSSDPISRKIARATDHEEQIRMNDFQHIDLEGISFSSQMSFSHGVQIKQSEDNPGCTQSVWATSMAASYSTNWGSALGALAMTSKTVQDLNANQSGKTDHRSDRCNTGGVMGMLQGEGYPWYLTGMFSYGQHNYKQERTWSQSIVNEPNMDVVANSVYKGYEISTAMEAGWKIWTDRTTIVQPYAGLSLSRLTQGAYVENSSSVASGESNSYGMSVPQQAHTTREAQGGVEALYVAASGDLSYQVRSRIGMSTQKVTGDVTTMTFTYQDSPNQAISVQVPNHRYNSLDLMFGVYSSLKENVFVSAMYTGKFGKYQNSSTAMVSVEYYIE